MCDDGRNAFVTQLYETYYDLMVLRLKRYLADYPDALGIAEECVQEVFITAGEKYKQLRSHHDIEGWLFRAAIYEMRKKQRKLCRQGEMEAFSLDILGPDKFAHPRDVLKQYLDEAEYLALLAYLKEHISQKDAAFFHELMVNERSNGELSEIFRIPGGTVKSRIHRLRNKLMPLVRKFLGLGGLIGMLAILWIFWLQKIFF